MRIATLFAAGDDGVAGQAAGLQDGGVDDRPQLLRRQRNVVINRRRSRLIFAARSTCMASAMPTSAMTSAALIFFTSAGGLDLALGEEASGLGFDADAQPRQFGRQA